MNETTLKTYAITWINLETNYVKCDTFSATKESEAVRDFKAVYRHGGDKRVLSVVPTDKEWQLEVA